MTASSIGRPSAAASASSARAANCSSSSALIALRLVLRTTSNADPVPKIAWPTRLAASLRRASVTLRNHSKGCIRPDTRKEKNILSASSTPTLRTASRWACCRSPTKWVLLWSPHTRSATSRAARAGSSRYTTFSPDPRGSGTSRDRLSTSLRSWASASPPSQPRTVLRTIRTEARPEFSNGAGSPIPRHSPSRLLTAAAS